MSEDLTKKLPSSDSEKILQQINSRLQSLEQKVEERLYDTRPIWQKVVTDIAQLHEGQVQLQEGQNRLEGSVREISYKLDVLNDTILTVQAKHRDLDVRVRELERHPQKPTNSET